MSYTVVGSFSCFVGAFCTHVNNLDTVTFDCGLGDGSCMHNEHVQLCFATFSSLHNKIQWTLIVDFPYFVLVETKSRAVARKQGYIYTSCTCIQLLQLY